MNYIHLFDAAFDSSIEFNEYSKRHSFFSYYSRIIYKNILLNKNNNNFIIYRNSILKINNSSNSNIQEDYTSEKFYILNKIIIEWTKSNFNLTNGFIFINSWNNYLEGNYLEPDEKYGFSSLNTFSKALFNYSFRENNYNILSLYDKCIIAIQAHIYYEDLIIEIIKKTNNIPFKFDLFITTVTLFQKKKIDEYIKLYSKANKYEIKIVENKGRDILPFVIQMKNKIKKYKYCCHIHTKKTIHNIILGDNWRTYLYENLLGSKEIITEILSDFETYEKLGFIFPDFYYDILKEIYDFYNIDFGLHRQNKKFMNYILNKIFPGYEIGNNLIFPSGNMFWAKLNSIHQIFKLKINKKFPKELNQTNETIMHGIERIWLYIVKLNGFNYKTIFKHY